MQRLDDVTGDPIRLSAAQRERQREAMIAMINAQTTQINTLTQAVKDLRRDANESSQRVTNIAADYDGHIAWHGSQASRTIWARLRWFLTGR